MQKGEFLKFLNESDDIYNSIKLDKFDPFGKPQDYDKLTSWNDDDWYIIDRENKKILYSGGSKNYKKAKDLDHYMDVFSKRYPGAKLEAVKGSTIKYQIK